MLESSEPGILAGVLSSYNSPVEGMPSTDGLSPVQTPGWPRNHTENEQLNKAAPRKRRARISLVLHKLDDPQRSPFGLPFGRSRATRFYPSFAGRFHQPVK
jgi:hypothetical protein